MRDEKDEKFEQTQYERMIEHTYLDVKWLMERWRPTNYLAVIVVSMITSAGMAWLITH